MSGFPLSEFFVLFGLGLFGTLAVIPYAFSLNRDKLSQVNKPLPVLALVSVLQTALLMALAVGVGLLAAQAVGMGAPRIQAALAGRLEYGLMGTLLPLSVGLGVISGALIVLLDRYVFGPHLPEKLRTADITTSAWKRFLASFYGGFGEEILMRLFLVSGLVWILSRFWQDANGLPAYGAYWTAIFLISLVFGLGHLPTTKAITPLTPSDRRPRPAAQRHRRDRLRLVVLAVWSRGCNAGPLLRRYCSAPGWPKVYQPQRQ